MDYVLRQLVIETTRRCNLQCGHCMRGPSQNKNLSPKIVDIFLDTNNIKGIQEIIFSGGEPTLNPEIIIYTINKIIKENLNVQRLVMVTNGQIFNKELIDTFNRFNEYRNKRVKESILNSTFDEELKKDWLRQNTDNHVRITFSTDRFHKDIDPKVRELYSMHAQKLKITDFKTDDSSIYKTGFSTIGKEFEYKLDQLRYYKEKDSYSIIDSIYITATGNMTSEGMGEYADMDRINMGSVYEHSLTEILCQYGTPIFDTPKITYPKPNIIKK